MFHKLVYLTMLVGCGGFALWRGGTPERIAATVFAISNLLTPLVQLAPHTRAGRLDPGITLIDFVTLAALLWLALRANRYWPLWLTAIHLLGSLGHFSRWLIHGQMNTWSYHVLISQGGYLIWPLIAIGAWRHHWRMRTYGADGSWVRFSAA